MNFNNCQFRGNAADEEGSALSLIVYQGCQISNCQFSANKAEPGNGVIYVETDFECPTMSTEPTSSPQTDIDRCIFEDNKGKDAGIALSCSQNAPVSIKNCQFQNCGSSGHVIAIQTDVQSTTIQNCSISNTDSIYSGGICVHSNGKIEIFFINFVLTSVDSALSIQSEESTEKVSVTHCLFDSCSVNSYSCFYISAKTNSFEFKDITVKNVKISGCDDYLGSLNLNGQITLALTNVSFTGVSSSCLYGGGTGMIFSGIPELIFDKCNFVNNEAHQDKSKSRPLANSDTIPYYNGDCGAIQIGCQAETAEMVLRFRDCNFRENKAFWHGGALAIQTIKELELYNCKLEQNIVNCDFETSSSNLLFENYFHKKKDGRGGAIYLNPASGCVDSFTQNVIINDCKLSWNKAHDGYAIYIEGDDHGTEFNIIKNNFNDNCDPNNHDSNDPSIIYGAVIATEIWNFTKDTLWPPGKPENNNCFSQSDNNLQINELFHVDHSGRTQTKAFTESGYFPADSFGASISFSYSAYFTNSSPFSPSDHFPSSRYFTDSDQFTKSSQFSESDPFSNSNWIKSFHKF
ncbi:hypothetical protein M9Y10_044436 [Tritrichomonas musculus]|uniref:Right handed beta helix domain-containing protein n=1 Tax=Tritrichomonas musculus TaxID=1915356 RepID=A0ABR2JSN8_9EUKA